MKNINWKKLLRTILSIALVATMILGCVTMLAGCNQEGTKDGKEDGKSEGENNKVDKEQYENLSDEEYMQKLFLNTAKEFVDELTAAYGQLGNIDPNATISGAANLEVSVQVGDYIIDMLEESYASSTGENMSFSFLSKIGLNMDYGINGDLMKSDLALMLSNKKIATVSMIMNMADSIAWLAIPELNDTYIELDMGEMIGMGDIGMGDIGMGSASVVGMAGQISEIMEVLPSEELLNTLITRYMEVVLKELDNVKRETVTLESDGLKQDCTAMTLTVYPADILDAAKAVLTTAKDDDDLKTALEGISELTGEDVYPQLTEMIDYYLEYLDEVSEEDIGTENYVELITYINSDHEIIGAAFTVTEVMEDDVHFYTVTEGNTFAFEAIVEPAGLEITGSGTNKSGTIDAEYTVNFQGMDYVVLEVEDWKVSGDTVNGTLRIEPTADALDMMMGDISGLPFADIALEIKLGQVDADSGTIELNLLGNDALVVGFVMELKPSSAGSIKEPSNSISATNQEALMNWVAEMDFDTILKNLRNAGVPGDLVDMLEQGLDSALNGGYAEPDYDYGYDDSWG